MIAVPIDRGYRCLVCRYNLTGLEQPTCPECGAVFSWVELQHRLLQRKRRIVAFERFPWYAKGVGWCVTALTAQFRPGRLARQLSVSRSIVHAMLFPIVLAPLMAIFAVPLPIGVFWVVCAFGLLAAQIPILALAERLVLGKDRRGREVFGFWFCASCYLSALVLPQLITGPPTLLERSAGWYIGGVGTWWEGLVALGHLGWWLGAIAALMRVRARRARKPRRVWLLLIALLPLLMIQLVIFALYGRARSDLWLWDGM